MTIRKILKKLALKVIPQQLIQADSCSLSALCLSLAKTGGYTVLQIGANDGDRHDPLKDIIARDRPRCWLVEPIPDYFMALSRKYAGRDDVTCVNVCISREDGEVEMYLVDPSKQAEEWQHGIASLDPNHFKRSGSEESLMISRKVRSVSFETLVAENKIPQVDVLVTDCEGYDLELIRMFPFDRLKPKLIQVEMDTNHVYTPDQCAELILLLVSHGYHSMRKENGDLLAWRS
jgi:FkbM family methyltransferase